LAKQFKLVCTDKLSNKMKMLIRKNVSEKNIEVFFCDNNGDTETHIGTADVLITFTNGISKEWIEQAESCRFIQKLGAGVNNIDIVEASRKGIAISNTRGLNARSVAEHTVLLMLALYKHLITAHNYIVQHGIWLKTGLRDFSYELTNKKIGLIGLGNIGREVVKLLKGFQCEIVYFDVNRISEEEERELGIQYTDVDTLLEISDVISLHVPLTKDTHHFINENKLGMMKSTALLINTCRGGVVDEEALYQVLKEKKILGAGFDVFEHEPIDQNHRFVSLDNVVITPHIGGGTVEAMEKVIEKACSNINYFLSKGYYLDETDVVNLEEIKEIEV
jgi:phosphoglycerate dehydrogenase-like enzyme